MKLHLVDYQKLKIGRAIVRYFKHVNGMRKTPLHTRKETELAYQAKVREAERINCKMLGQNIDMRRAINKAKKKRLTMTLFS